MSIYRKCQISPHRFICFLWTQSQYPCGIVHYRHICQFDYRWQIGLKAIIVYAVKAPAAENASDNSLQGDGTATSVEMIQVDSAGFGVNRLSYLELAESLQCKLAGKSMKYICLIIINSLSFQPFCLLMLQIICFLSVFPTIAVEVWAGILQCFCMALHLETGRELGCE